MDLDQKRSNGKCCRLNHLLKNWKSLKSVWNRSEARFNGVPQEVESWKRWDKNGVTFCGLDLIQSIWESSEIIKVTDRHKDQRIMSR